METHFYSHIANLRSPDSCLISFREALEPFTPARQQEKGFTPRPSNDSLSLTTKLMKLKEEHRKTDQHIQTLASVSSSDKIALQRLKRRKLLLKDEIKKISSLILPDIIA